VAADAPERVFLVGMVGAGKTTIGHALSKRTGWPYIDNDDLVKSMTGRDSAEIFETDGEDVLHLAEIQALDVAFGTDPPLVVGVAGAVVGDPAAREALREGGHVVWLRARPETLIARVGDGEGRRADAANPDWIRARLREREPLYAVVAHQIVDVDDATPEAIAETILEAIPAARA
jgi:shikimate kinase